MLKKVFIRISLLFSLLLITTLSMANSFSWTGAAYFTQSSSLHPKFYGHLTMGMGTVTASSPIDAVEIQHMLVAGGFDTSTHHMYPIQFDLIKPDLLNTKTRKIQFNGVASGLLANGDQIGQYRDINFSAKLATKTPFFIVNDYTATFIGQLSRFSQGVYGDSLIAREMKNDDNAIVYITINTKPNKVIDVLRNGTPTNSGVPYTAIAYVK